VPPETSVERRIHWMHSIKVKTWLGVLLITIIPLVAMSWYVYGVLTVITRDLVIKNNLQAFQRVKAEVDRFVQTYVDLVHLLQHDSCLRDPASAEAAAALRQIQQGYDFIERLVVVGTGSSILTTASRDGSATLPLTAAEQRAILATEPVSFGAGCFYAKGAIDLASPSVAGGPGRLYVRGGDDGAPPLATVFATVSFLKLRKTLENLALGTSFQFYVVSREGDNLLERPEFPVALAHDLVHRPLGTYDVQPQGSPVPTQVAIVLPILHYGLKVVILQDAEEVYAILHGIKARFIVAISIVAIVAFLFGLTALSPQRSSIGLYPLDVCSNQHLNKGDTFLGTPPRRGGAES